MKCFSYVFGLLIGLMALESKAACLHCSLLFKEQIQMYPLGDQAGYKLGVDEGTKQCFKQHRPSFDLDRITRTMAENVAKGYTMVSVASGGGRCQNGCRSYALEVFYTGEVNYTDTKIESAAYGKEGLLSPEKMAAIFDYIEKNDLMNQHYEKIGHVFDMPSTRIYIEKGEVEFQYSFSLAKHADPKMLTLVNMLDDMREHVTWTETATEEGFSTPVVQVSKQHKDFTLDKLKLKPESYQRAFGDGYRMAVSLCETYLEVHASEHSFHLIPPQN